MFQQNNQRFNDYAKYSSLAFQMLVVILLFIFGGYKLDHWLTWNFPLFTVLGSLIGVGMSIYIALKDLLRKK